MKIVILLISLYVVYNIHVLQTLRSALLGIYSNNKDPNIYQLMQQVETKLYMAIILLILVLSLLAIYYAILKSYKPWKKQKQKIEVDE